MRRGHFVVNDFPAYGIPIEHLKPHLRPPMIPPCSYPNVVDISDHHERRLSPKLALSMNVPSAATRTFPSHHANEKVLFLDAAGVMHSIFASGVTETFNPDCMMRLKAIVDATQCAIVLARGEQDLDPRDDPLSVNAVNEALSRFEIPCCLAWLPETGCCTPEYNQEWTRHGAIMTWLSRNPTRRWLVLDASASLFQLRKHSVVLDPLRGLQDENVAQAVCILNEPDLHPVPEWPPAPPEQAQPSWQEALLSRPTSAYVPPSTPVDLLRPRSNGIRVKSCEDPLGLAAKKEKFAQIRSELRMR